MDHARQYWTFVQLTAAGQLRHREHLPARTYFEQQWGNLPPGFPHRDLQRRLLQQLQDEGILLSSMKLSADLHPAEACLRCYISHQIHFACQQLEEQFGPLGGFTRADLLPFVLDDDRLQSRTTSTPYRSLATEILETFDPERSSLSVWTVRRVRHHKEVNATLLEHGIYLVSDWAILNDTSLPQAERILLDFHGLSAFEIQQASALLESYHAVYRSDRLRQKQHSRDSSRCLPPDTQQLQRMVDDLQEEFAIKLPVNEVMERLQTLAQQLRDYRIYVRSKVLPTKPIDDSDQTASLDHLPAPRDGDEDYTIKEFLERYRQQFLTCLDEALQTVVEQRVRFLQRRKGDRHQRFLKGLHLFHCIGQTMGAIASQIDCKRQDQVTYLLQLKQLRADVRHHLENLLRDRTHSLAQAFVDPSRLQSLDQQIDDALNEQLTDLVRDAETESSTSRNGPLQSLFSRRLCQYLDTKHNFR